MRVGYLRFAFEGLPPRECLADLPDARLQGLARDSLMALEVRTGRYSTMLVPAAKLAPDFTSFHAATSAVVTWKRRAMLVTLSRRPALTVVRRVTTSGVNAIWPLSATLETTSARVVVEYYKRFLAR